MRKVSFSDMNCSVAQTLELVGEWWTLLIIRDSFLGVRRFDDFVERLGISRNVLTDRLDKLVAADILERHEYDAGRSRFDYVLTERGRDLWPIITSLRQWGDRWILGQGNEPIVVRHLDCGHVVHVEPTCDSCGERMNARSVRAEVGPGNGSLG